MQNANKAKDTYYKTRHWAQQHKLCLPQAPLPQPILDVIEEWFFLVDDDGSGSLDAEELEAAFTVRSHLLYYTVQPDSTLVKQF